MTNANGYDSGFPACVLETRAAFYVWPPYDANASLCESPWDYAGLIPVLYQLSNERADANHRYTTDKAVRDAMVARGYIAEGDWPRRDCFLFGVSRWQAQGSVVC